MTRANTDDLDVGLSREDIWDLSPNVGRRLAGTAATCDMSISVIVASLNEAKNIYRCLDSLFSQRDFNNTFEVIVVDGMSSDGTQDIVRNFPEYGKRLRLLANPNHLQVYAWNLGLRAATGTFYAMMSAHAEYGPTYFASCLEVMERTGAAAVGGIARARGTGPVGRVVAWCMSTPFGIGNARFRYSAVEEETDSVPFMFARRDALLRVGGFDETLPFEEDSDINYRLRKAGAKLVLSPAIEVQYHVRSSLRGLLKQMYRYGYWRYLSWQKHKSSFPWRVFIPPALVTSLVISVVLAALGMTALAAVAPGAYSLFLLVAALASVATLGWSAALVPLVLFSMHSSYGAGWWVALLRHGPWRISRA